jgi:antitoxin component YwqK of YwqJK toxin-antitoxin module
MEINFSNFNIMIVYDYAYINNKMKSIITFEIPTDASCNFIRQNLVNTEYATYNVTKLLVKKIEDLNNLEFEQAKYDYYDGNKLNSMILRKNEIIESPFPITNDFINRPLKFFLNKNVAISNFRIEKDGLNERWDFNGNLEVEYYLTKGMKNGIFRLYSNGIKLLDCNYINNKLDGSFKSWYKNGNKKIESTYNNNLLNGHYKEFNENGTVKKECDYVNGKEV